MFFLTVFRFAQILHPRNIEDARDKSKILRALPATWVEKIIPRIPPIRISAISGLSSRGRIEGYFIYLGLTTQQLAAQPGNSCLEKILKCGRLAEKKGVQLLGLGGVAAAMGDADIKIARCLQSAVTTGRTLCVATAVESACRLVEQRGMIGENMKCTIIDASSPLGGPCLQLLARYGFTDFTLVTEQKHRLDNLAWKMLYDHGISVKITSCISRALEKADLIIITDGISGEKADAAAVTLKKGTMVCNLCRRKFTDRGLFSTNNGVTLIDGGMIKVPPQISFNKNFDFSVSRTIPADMAETIILAMERKKHSFSLGDGIRMEKMDEMTEMARKHNFQLVGYLSQDIATFFS
ncbi:MAG: hypothetical protein GX364_05395 [Firmicutes bacterium]|nr:hypothetical protein [Bacillota bacterium]